MGIRRAAIAASALFSVSASAQDVSTYTNPILPGFHPDPTCTFVPSLNDTTFCTFSSFITFPGLPIYASQDLQNWKLISNALVREEQLPALEVIARGSTSGIYAPTLRYREDEGKFYLITTLANQALYGNNYTRFDNFILTTTNIFQSSHWSDPVRFDFPGIDPSPLWEDDGTTYITGSYNGSNILQAEVDLSTGERYGAWTNIWNGTGLPSPEAPHVYKKDGWYYLLTAEGGTRERHRSNMARSRNLFGPYEGDPNNPVLSAYNTSGYFQAVGHSDIFPDARGQYWAIALGVRAGPGYNRDPYNSLFPMGREALLTPVQWPEGEWPTFQNVTGVMTGNFTLPSPSPPKVPAEGEGGLVGADDAIDFAPGSNIPPHLFYWRFPVKKNYEVSPAGHPNTLRLGSSVLNLTSFDADSTRGQGQTFLARRQTTSLFRYSIDVDYSTLSRVDEEVGVTALQDQAQHFDISVVMLRTGNSTTNTTEIKKGTGADVQPHIRFRGISTTTYRLPERFKYVDESWQLPTELVGQKVRLQVEAVNTTHYAFSAGPATENSTLGVFGWTRGNYLVPYYSGVVVGVFATSNGRYGESAFDAYVSRWRYTGVEQVRTMPADQQPIYWD